MIRRFLTAPLAALILCLAVPQSADATVNYTKVSKPYTAWSAASTTGTATLYTTRQAEVFWKVVMVRDTDFAGGAVSAATVSVGKSGSTTKYQAATDVFTGVSNGWTNAIHNITGGGEAAGTAITATLLTTGADTDALTAGKLTFYIYHSGAFQ